MNRRFSSWFAAPLAMLCIVACGTAEFPPTQSEISQPEEPNDGDSALAQPSTPQTGTCAVVDFDTDGNGSPLPAGTIVNNQYASAGILSISCTNLNENNPDECIIFDSSAPTGGDDDLGTPNGDFGGPGVGSGGEQGQVGENNMALGNLLIIAENIDDADNDGLVDDPDDEGYGGIFTITFDGPTKVKSLTMVDIDANEPGFADIFFDGGGSLQLPFSLLGSNSVQKIMVEQENVVKVELHLCASGALADIDFCQDSGGCLSDLECNETETCEEGVCTPIPATVGGTTFSDVNSNGLRDPGELGLSGVAMDLHADADQDGMPDDSTPEDSTTSDATGAYTFNGVNPFGTYVVGFQNLTMFGFGYSPQNVGSNDLIDSDVNPLTGYTDTFTMLPAEVDNTISCGYKVVQ